jgi:hypothetical protein
MRLKTLTPAVSRSESRATSVALPPELTPFQLEMIKILDIPVHLTDRPQGTADLRIAYTKYEALLEAKAKLLRMRNNGSWTLRKPKSEELTEIFVSKTVWHSKYTKLFPVAKDHPHLMKWLENTPDAPANTDIFGVEKNAYSFKDLASFIQKAGEVASKKGKRKAKGSVSEGGQKKKKGKAQKDSASEQSSASE